MTNARRIARIACLAACGLSAPSAAAASVWDADRFGVGVRAAALGLESAASRANRSALAGAGVQVRYALHDAWQLELSLEGLHEERAGGAFTRDWTPATLSVLWHPRPQDVWNWYFLAGIGGGRDEVAYRTIDGSVEKAAFEQALVHAGVGVERRFEHIAFSAELRAVGAGRDDTELDGAAHAGRDRPVPPEASGQQFSLIATYYF